MWSPGLGELTIILVIVLVLFGAGKLTSVGRDLGGAIKEFKKSVKPVDEEEKTDTPTDTPTEEPNQS